MLQDIETVGIHAEPRRLNPRLIPDRLQPCLAVLIVCMNTQILIVRLRRPAALSLSSRAPEGSTLIGGLLGRYSVLRLLCLSSNTELAHFWALCIFVLA
ncbi:hypothetical protein J5N97_007286 [Dioscorea zingiberensis]|uniref:Uncharacterized protein n=1 Tax=Dioscorea zingiberensis TaxID=325984 RepID=A0A9D5DDM7_9LILI|nr:hypothetical protein J5N97_007286 [Dioscorea zingiberensis]